MNNIGYIRTAKYLGSKYRFLSIIEPYVKKSNKRILIDPFCGSGCVPVNFSKYFDKVYINDKDRNILKILNGYKNYTYKEYSEFIKQYGKDLLKLKDKEFYYKFRDKMNEKWFDTNTYQESFFLYYISCACINSMFRCGNKGFNAAYGRGTDTKFMNKQEYDRLSKCFKNVEISNMDYKDFFKYLNNIGVKPKNCLMFLDPPYLESNFIYDTTINKNDIKKLLKNNCDVLYTDIYDDTIKLPFILLRNMVNIKPFKGKKVKNIEVMYYKIKK